MHNHRLFTYTGIYSFKSIYFNKIYIFYGNWHLLVYFLHWPLTLGILHDLQWLKRYVINTAHNKNSKKWLHIFINLYLKEPKNNVIMYKIYRKGTAKSKASSFNLIQYVTMFSNVSQWRGFIVFVICYNIGK